MCVALPTDEQELRGETDDDALLKIVLVRFPGPLRVAVGAFSFLSFFSRGVTLVCFCHREGKRSEQLNHGALSRGQPGTLTSPPEMSLLCVGGKRRHRGRELKPISV